jgi:Lrp/AsnC family transcriptional regulator for asnA, asnC and gidA
MPHKLDKIDEDIICLLQEDGRMPSAEIARQIGGAVTERIVRFRIMKLCEDGVIHISAFVDPEKIGFPVLADVWISVENVNIMEVAHSLAALDQVSYVACSTGEWDISIQVYARSNLELHTFVTETVLKVPGVKKANFVVLPIVLKDLYAWRVRAIGNPDVMDQKD